MNQRIQTLLELIEDGVGVIDVGTDHGYLPTTLAKRGYLGNLIASDIKEGPLSAAKATAAYEQVQHKIQFLLCDGLQGCDPRKIDTIVIAGMGGDTICRILDLAEWTMDPRYTMLLQPMTKAEVLRYWLTSNEYGIVEERLVEDAGRCFSILRVRFGSECDCLNDGEMFTGAYHHIRRDPLCALYLQDRAQRLGRALSGLQAGGEGESGKAKLLATAKQQIEEMLRDANGSGNI